VSLTNWQLIDAPTGLATSLAQANHPQAVPIGELEGPSPRTASSGDDGGHSGKGGFATDEDALQARLDNLRRT